MSNQKVCDSWTQIGPDRHSKKGESWANLNDVGGYYLEYYLEEPKGGFLDGFKKIWGEQSHRQFNRLLGESNAVNAQKQLPNKALEPPVCSRPDIFVELFEARLMDGVCA